MVFSKNGKLLTYSISRGQQRLAGAQHVLSVLSVQPTLGTMASYILCCFVILQVLPPQTFKGLLQVSLGAIAFSKDGNLLTYSISKGGSDWQELKMMRIDQSSGKAEELKDVLKHVKFSSTAWTHDHKVRQSSSGLQCLLANPPTLGQALSCINNCTYKLMAWQRVPECTNCSESVPRWGQHHWKQDEAVRSAALICNGMC